MIRRDKFNNNFIKIIKEICYIENISLTILSNDWILCLEKNGKSRFIAVENYFDDKKRPIVVGDGNK